MLNSETLSKILNYFYAAKVVKYLKPTNVWISEN
jgi:hypothetical protein